MDKVNKSRPPLIFRYKNWQDGVEVRHVIPVEVFWGKTEWHPKEQWLMKAWDLDKDAERTFAVKDIQEFFPKD